MKQLGYKFACLFFLISFISSCKSSYVMTIEVQKPAAVTFPAGIDGIVIVNNAVPQPSDKIVDLKINKKGQEMSLTLDSEGALQKAVSSIAQNLQKEDYFKNVFVKETSLRNDEEWLSLNAVPIGIRDSIYEKTGCNILVSVDRLIFSLEESVASHSDEYFFIEPGTVFLNVRAKATMTCSIYNSNREKRMTSFSVQDSSVFLNAAIQADSIAIFKEIPNLSLQQMSQLIGEKTASFFTPTWEVADRMIYSSPNSRMQEADRYFKSHKWNNARTIWAGLYEEKTDLKGKGRLAMNIAVSYEMEDQLSTALEWANQAKEYYDRMDPSKVKDEQQLIEEYIQALAKRINDNRLLDIQFGAKND